MVKLDNILGLDPEPNWDRMDWLRAIIRNKEKLINNGGDDDHDKDVASSSSSSSSCSSASDDDDDASRVFRGRAHIASFLYQLELSAREEYFSKHGSLLRQLASLDSLSWARKGKRSSSCRKPRGVLCVWGSTTTATDRHEIKNPEETHLKKKRKMGSDDHERDPELTHLRKRMKKSTGDHSLPLGVSLSSPLSSLMLLSVAAGGGGGVAAESSGLSCDSLKDCITGVGGRWEDAVLVIEKRLFKSDVARNNNRFSIPFNQLKNDTFLTEEEKKHLDGRRPQFRDHELEITRGVPADIEVMLIEPSLKHSCPLRLKRWDMSSCKMYVLVNGWRHVVERNGLDHGMSVRLWSFRVSSKLWFALVRV